MSPQAGAAALLAGATGHAVLTEVERQEVDSVLMRLFLMTGPKAAALRGEVGEGTLSEAAEAAAALETDERERLIGHLWSLGGGENAALLAAGDAFGLTEAQLAALRPATSEGDG